MMVIFVSQCEKNALKKTRRVLDAFANRIGDNTWQTIITEDGLQTVKKMLRQTASKSTAVSCHWLRGRSRSELVWVVGRRDRFNQEGIVPVNITNEDISIYQDYGCWKSLPLMESAVNIAGLFHDFGKANQLFQIKLHSNKKLPSEPFRHEWVSLSIFEGFVGDQSDKDWLRALAEIDSSYEFKFIKEGVDSANKHRRLHDLKSQSFAQLVAWLILTHHKLPQSKKNTPYKNHDDEFIVNTWMEESFNASWNSKFEDAEEYDIRKRDNWTISEYGLPHKSAYWRTQANLGARKALDLVFSDANILHEDLFTSHISRLGLMLADHYFSNEKHTPVHEWRSCQYPVYANTQDRKVTQRKEVAQQLDEHLIGVAVNANKIIRALPKLKESLPSLEDNYFLEKPCSKEQKHKFGWQDNAVKIAKKIAEKTQKHGFFGINMASTGCGKTLANAKIMYTIGNETDGVRFNVALGLRTLTLQTGREFKKILKLSKENLAIAVGGIAVKALFEQENTTADGSDFNGSESANEVINIEHIQFDGGYKEHALSQWTKNKNKIERLINAPVLCCTIDHLIPATEGTRGGQQIGPMLRLLTSDLIIDEPDDFGLEDLPALSRLVHWAGMLGSRVLLSTATMPPALVYACYQSYQSGWKHFAKVNVNGDSEGIQCAWYDETQKPIEGIYSEFSCFKNAHQEFVKERIRNLKGLNSHAKQKGKIIPILSPENESEDIYKRMAKTIQNHALELHGHHCNEQNGVSISIGLVRMANIKPLVKVAKQLIKQSLKDKNIAIHYCVYHSRFPLAIRSSIEHTLDRVLNRKNEMAIWDDDAIKAKLNDPDKTHHIFIVLASPVAEVGRDHDYDWAIVEPSSMRSIIQIAGRVLRHRDKIVNVPNVYLLNQNIKALNNVSPCFNRPGFESFELNVSSRSLETLLNKAEYEVISAIPRIERPSKLDLNTKSSNTLTDLEHKALIYTLVKDEKPASVWWTEQAHWCAEIQKQQRFRKSQAEETCVLMIKDEYATPDWQMKNTKLIPSKLMPLSGLKIQEDRSIISSEGNDFWLKLEPLEVYKDLEQKQKLSLEKVSEIFGEVCLPVKSNDQMEYYYHPQLGLYEKE